MAQSADLSDPNAVALAHLAEIRALDDGSAPHVRPLYRKLARSLADEPAEFVLAVARELLQLDQHPGHAYALLALHKPAFRTLGAAELEEFGQGMAGWGPVDFFARALSGPAWVRGQVSDALIDKWARSENRWWRRAALVSTVALNVKVSGGRGDTGRTLAVCRILAADGDDMVFKALSWALRALVAHDPGAVRKFLRAHDEVLAARVKREVRNKLTTGLKNPRRKRE
jgi:3-methyladenine DNA glycosylase AlkD